MELVTDRMICEKMIRLRTPLRKYKRSDFPSPSRLAADQLLLPNLTMDGEFAAKKKVTASFKTYVPPAETNPYSIDNIKLPEDKIPLKKSKSIFKVKTAAEVKSHADERSKINI